MLLCCAWYIYLHIYVCECVCVCIFMFSLGELIYLLFCFFFFLMSFKFFSLDLLNFLANHNWIIFTYLILSQLFVIELAVVLI